jgi:hypothetical protein
VIDLKIRNQNFQINILRKILFNRGHHGSIYCANEIVSCNPALVLVIGAVVAIFGMVLSCWKNKEARMRLLTT